MVFGASLPFIVNGTNLASFFEITPIIYQIKTGFQLFFGDIKGAVQMFNNYFSKGWLSSQIIYIYHLVRDNAINVLNIQKKNQSNIEPVIEGLPLIEHIKGYTHIMNGDKENGWDIIKSGASSTDTVIDNIIFGPSGAILGSLDTGTVNSGLHMVHNQDDEKQCGIPNITQKGKSVDKTFDMSLDIVEGSIIKKTNIIEVSKQSIEPHRMSNSRSSNDAVCTSIRRNDINPKSSFYQKLLEEENINELKKQSFEHFCQQDKFYNTLGDKNKIHDFQNNGELLNYKETTYLNELNVESLRDKLQYLSNNLRSLIKKNDFKTINIMQNDHASCSLAGVLDIDIGTLHRIFVEPDKLPNIPASSIIFHSLNEIKKSGYIEFTSSMPFKDILGFKNYLKSDGRYLNHLPLLLNMEMPDGSVDSLRLKFKIVNNELELLLINYQKPGLMLSNLPNPDRFIPFIDKKYIKFTIYSINKLKPFMLLEKRLSLKSVRTK